MTGWNEPGWRRAPQHHHGRDDVDAVPMWAVELYNDVRAAQARGERLERALYETNKRLEMLMAVTQADIDALTASLGDMKTKLTSADAGLQAEIDSLKSANPELDLSGLQAVANDLSSQVDATAAMVPAAPAPSDGSTAPADGSAPSDGGAPVDPTAPADATTTTDQGPQASEQPGSF